MTSSWECDAVETAPPLGGGYSVADQIVVSFGLGQALTGIPSSERLEAAAGGDATGWALPSWDQVGLRLGPLDLPRHGAPQVSRAAEVAWEAVSMAAGAAGGVVAALFEGSLADLVLLHHLAALAATDTHVLLLVPDRITAEATSSALGLSGVLADHVGSCEVLVLEPDRLVEGHSEGWRPAGPALGPLPDALAAALLTAREHGSPRLLTASGVMDVFRWPPAGAGLPLTRSGGASAVWRGLAREAARQSNASARAVLATVAARVTRLAVEQPWVDRSGSPLPEIVAPLLWPEVVSACLTGGFAPRPWRRPWPVERSTSVRRHVAVARLVPEAVRGPLLDALPEHLLVSRGHDQDARAAVRHWVAGLGSVIGESAQDGVSGHC